jgi:ACS family sodium-dependent inorganic phosphate cotransporter-like MFS transporter 5
MAVSEGDHLKSYPMGWRHVVTIISFFGFLVVYTLRVNLSVALVAMVNQTAVNEKAAYLAAEKGENLTKKPSICYVDQSPLNKTVDVISLRADGPYEWDTELQGIVLASFFYGYITTQLAGGWLAGRYGAKWVFGIGTVWTAVLTLLSPLAAELGVGVLIALRILEGVGEGVTWPAMQAFFARWAPPSERSKLPAISYAGCFVGTPFAFILSGILADSNFMGGWPSVFYVFGILGCIWFVFWVFLVSSSPEGHRYISTGEKTYILRALEAESGGMSRPGLGDVPWKKIFASPAVWAVFVGHFSYNWGLYVLLTSLPTYFKTVFGFDIKKNGLLSALPYIVQSIIHVSSGQLADLLRTKLNLRTVTVRKIFDCLGHFLPAVFVIALGYVGCNSTAAIVLLTLCIGFTGLCGAGFLVNFLDIAPQFAGILLGTGNTFATIPGIVGPYITGVLTKDATIESWRTVFFICGGIYLFSAIFFAIFAQGTAQPWANARRQPAKTEETNVLKDY